MCDRCKRPSTGSSVARTRWSATLKSKSARSSRLRTLARTSPPSYASRKNTCARRCPVNPENLPEREIHHEPENHSLPDLQRQLQGSLCPVQKGARWRAVFPVVRRCAGRGLHPQGCTEQGQDPAHPPDGGGFQPDGVRLSAASAVQQDPGRLGVAECRQR